jgi:predicted TPR repeat methyltransferase
LFRDEADERASDLTRPLTACADGLLPANVALMQLLTMADSEQEANGALNRVIASEQRKEAAQRIEELKRLWDGAPNCFATLSSIAKLARRTEARNSATTTDDIAALFDTVHGISPEAGVALYSLGQPSLLDAATEEIIALIDSWGLCNSKSRVLDLGCGTGRMLAALAPRVGEIAGVDISEAMIQAAKSRVRHLPNASVSRISGRDFSERTGPFDLVLAIDSFPYLVQTGVAKACIASCAWLLREGGHLLILNYSYRGDLAKDSADVTDFAARAGLHLLRAGVRDLKLWDGTTFLLQRA